MELKFNQILGIIIIFYSLKFSLKHIYLIIKNILAIINLEDIEIKYRNIGYIANVFISLYGIGIGYSYYHNLSTDEIWSNYFFVLSVVLLPIIFIINAVYTPVQSTNLLNQEIIIQRWDLIKEELQKRYWVLIFPLLGIFILLEEEKAIYIPIMIFCASPWIMTLSIIKSINRKIMNNEF